MGSVDPYEAVARRQSYMKKDSFKLFIKASDCITVDDLSGRKGTPMRFLWRPPRNYITKASGTVHGDSRGSLTKWLGSKIVIKNKCNADIRFKATVPVGEIHDPHQIYARPIVSEGTIKPTGTVKDMSRSRGKGKKKREKSYSKKVDQITIDVTERSLFTGDANQYTLYEESMPGDNSTTEPAYYVMGKGVVDCAVILPNANQYSGEKYQPDLIVAEIVVVVRYIVSGVGVEDVSTVDAVPAFTCGALNSMDAIYHVDVTPLVTPTRSGALTNPLNMIRLPQRDGANELQLVGSSKSAFVLYYSKSGRAIEKFRWKEHETTGSRMVIFGLSAGVYIGGYVVGSAEVKYIGEREAWCVVTAEGKPLLAGDAAPGKATVSSYCPAVMYIDKTKDTGTGGLIKNYGHKNSKAVSWKSVIAALTTTIKVLEGLARVASLFV